MINQENIKDVLMIPEQSGDEKQWIRIGVAFENKDGSLNVILESVPLNGRMHIRNRVVKKEVV